MKINPFKTKNNHFGCWLEKYSTKKKEIKLFFSIKLREGTLKNSRTQ